VGVVSVPTDLLPFQSRIDSSRPVPLCIVGGLLLFWDERPIVVSAVPALRISYRRIVCLGAVPFDAGRPDACGYVMDCICRYVITFVVEFHYDD
jgi:hypothetical protein